MFPGYTNSKFPGYGPGGGGGDVAAIEAKIPSEASESNQLADKAFVNLQLANKQDIIDDLIAIRTGAALGATALQSEVDPVFTASPAHGITASDITNWDGKASKVAIVNHGTSDTTFTLTPNVFHVWGTVASLTLTLATPTDDTIVNEYMFQFTSGSTATTLSLPSTVVWDEEKGEISIEMGYIYQVSILNNIALWARVAV